MMQDSVNSFSALIENGGDREREDEPNAAIFNKLRESVNALQVL
jgi:hypothetical protein